MADLTTYVGLTVINVVIIVLAAYALVSSRRRSGKLRVAPPTDGRNRSLRTESVSERIAIGVIVVGTIPLLVVAYLSLRGLDG